jgi:hypothetical protein
VVSQKGRTWIEIFENRMLKVFGAKRQAVRRRWRKYHNIVSVTRARKM